MTTIQLPAPSITASLLGDRLRAALAKPFVRFAVVGGAGTALQLLVQLSLAATVGVTVAAMVAWLVSTVVTNLAHRAFTFRVTGSKGAAGDFGMATAACLLGLASASLVSNWLAGSSTVTLAVGLMAANGVAGGLRFLFLRWWLTGRPQATVAPANG